MTPSPPLLDRRRQMLRIVLVLPGLAFCRGANSAGETDARRFIDAAFREYDRAIAAGDQAYGAVVVLDGKIVGYGPSRVVVDANNNAHAERVALWDAQKRLGRSDLSGAVIYSTSRPCAACQAALARARVARMVFGAGAIDAGPPSAGTR